MNIDKCITRPQLQEVVLDNEEIIKTYGEPIKFWMMDHIGINTYFEFYRSQSETEGERLTSVLRRLILNSEGKPVMGDEDALPVDITLNVLEKVNEVLGKSRTKLSIQKTGEPQE